MGIQPNALSSNPLVRPFQQFFRTEAAGGVLLLVCALVALVWANTPWAASYFALWSTVVTAGFGSFEISKPLLLWINDGLMAIFFFVVGLEIKREVLMGELGSPRKAALALVAALGGMVVPALLYTAVNAGGEGAAGWGIPMATDIAFALGVLALLGRRAPLALKVFLTALAIIDDLGAVLVIAFFYTAQLELGYLAFGAGVLAALVILNRSGVRRTAPYLVLGVALWLAFLKSGVHATIAGVLLAMTIPARRLLDDSAFLARGRELLDRFARDVKPGEGLPTADQADVLHALEDAAERLDTPLHRMEHALHGWVAFGIMPVFALANAGVALGGGLPLGSPVTLGVILGLFAGKQLGVTGFSWLAVRMGWAELPQGVSWRQLYGVSLLTGIGFTMSLFIANLAFDSPAVLDGAKVGILAASLIAGVAGWLVLSRGAARE
jgi:NhaA family Na+:H+ antiporter